MTTEQRIHCTIHWRTSDSTGQRDLLLPDRKIADIVPLLVERLGLQQYVAGPAQGQAALYRTEETDDQLSMDASLTELHLQDGDHIWLIIIPQFVRIGLTLESIQGTSQSDELVPTQVAIKDLTQQLITQHNLEILIHGPSKGIAHLAVYSEPKIWQDTDTLLSHHVHDGDRIVLHIEPTRIPVLLHWKEGAESLSKEIYIPKDEIIEKHIAYFISLLGCEEQISGPSKSIATLHHHNNANALATQQTLSEAGVAIRDPLWLRLTPQFATLTLRWEQNDNEYHQQARLALFEPITEIIKQLTDILQLHPSRITVRTSESQATMQPDRTLRDYGIAEGDTLWLATAPPDTALVTQFPWWYSVLGVLFVALLGYILWSRTVVPTPTVMVATQIVTVTVIPSLQATSIAPSPTVDIQNQKRIYYTLGREAYDQQDWARAIDYLEKVVAIEPDYLNTRELLITSYNNWAIVELRTPDSLASAREKFQRTLVLSPTNQLARDEIKLIDLYQQGRQLYQEQQWAKALEPLEQLYTLQPDFLDTAALLYTSYIRRGTQLEAESDYEKAKDMYRSAQQIADVDTTEATNRLAILEKPTPKPNLPKATEVPTSRPKPIVLITIPDMRYADVGRARQYLKELGFNPLPPAVVPADQIGDLCRGEVSYTSPKSGLRKAKGTQVRIFYRDWNDNLPNPARCSP